MRQAKFDVDIYEDNAGGVYLVNPATSEVWGFGPVTMDLRGLATALCQDWAGGEWEPNTLDGQTRRDDVEDLTLIGQWDSVNGLRLVELSGQLAAGAGGRLFMLGASGERASVTATSVAYQPAARAYVISKDGTIIPASDCFIVELDGSESVLNGELSDEQVGAYASSRGRPMVAPGPLSANEEYGRATEWVAAALDQLDRAVRRLVAQKVKATYPTAVTLVTFGEYNEDGLLHARCDRIFDADHNVLAESDEPTDAWGELTDNADPLLYETSELSGDDYLGEVEIDLTEWED